MGHNRGSAPEAPGGAPKNMYQKNRWVTHQPRPPPASQDAAFPLSLAAERITNVALPAGPSMSELQSLRGLRADKPADAAPRMHQCWTPRRCPEAVGSKVGRGKRGGGPQHQTCSRRSAFTPGRSHAKSARPAPGPVPLPRAMLQNTALAEESPSPPASATAPRPSESAGSQSRPRQAVPAGEMPENRSCPAEPHAMVGIRWTAKPRPTCLSFINIPDQWSENKILEIIVPLPLLFS
ncbi:hypothetical protein NDU88_004545 [Pleurodeles waltl]|uniref:Uncharacterized protein n=1 Tax=Pleurodeles waltl TaxID=8319 RepID=A0AAV7VL35_PLEWA|nr:hypothetical protein NDU88_004545 [Pleurodeles waltl]